MHPLLCAQTYYKQQVFHVSLRKDALMVNKYNRHILQTSLIALLFLLSACSIPGLASSPPSPAQMLLNSTDAMSHLKSAHIDFQASLSIQPATAPTKSTNGLTFNATGHSDVADPDKVSLDLSVGQTPFLSLITIGQKVYVRGQDGA